ncbi:hypothetical protein [Sphingobium agri]|uniref:Uncharacterized protein n=1 Tax=Sphingobium agri TaxID=2933566 RepID=A0ABT0E1X1_9SPHN|nr:hypothetical protein [Sphingobium agri]MCK0533374.1 hypothetical protein [Sphingobium agri]
MDRQALSVTDIRDMIEKLQSVYKTPTSLEPTSQFEADEPALATRQIAIRNSRPRNRRHLHPQK